MEVPPSDCSNNRGVSPQAPAQILSNGLQKPYSLSVWFLAIPFLDSGGSLWHSDAAARIFHSRKI